MTGGGESSASLLQPMAPDPDHTDGDRQAESATGTETEGSTKTRASEPISVISFGRSGSGKSTLAQMLTLGRLDPASHLVSSSGIRGETKKLQNEANRDRGWSVVDTPGFGQTKDRGTTISSEDAEEMLRKYLKEGDRLYTHFLYTVMRDRIDEMDKSLWKFFVQRCGEDLVKTHFTVVVSNASNDWVEQNKPVLEASFMGCNDFIGAEFPSVRSDDREWEGELANIRNDSLKQLEKHLAGLGRHPVKGVLDGYWESRTKQVTHGAITGVITRAMFVKDFLSSKAGNLIHGSPGKGSGNAEPSLKMHSTEIG